MTSISFQIHCIKTNFCPKWAVRLRHNVDKKFECTKLMDIFKDRFKWSSGNSSTINMLAKRIGLLY